MKIRILNLYIYPFEDLQCGYGLQQGNIMPSLKYIPGRVVRGGLAGWAIRNGYFVNSEDSLFQGLFLPHENRARVSFPTCMPNGAHPLPCSFFIRKGKLLNPRTKMVKEEIPVFAETDEKIEDHIRNNTLTGPVNFLKRDKWPSDMDAALKPATGLLEQPLNTISNGLALKIELRAAHNADGRVDKNAGLFAQEVMPNAVTNEKLAYQGELVFVDEPHIKNLFHRLTDLSFDPDTVTPSFLAHVEPDHLIFIGRRKIPAAIFATEKEVVDTEQTPPPFEQIDTITLTTDCIPEAHIPVNPGGQAFNKLFEAHALQKQKAFCRNGSVHGYDINQGKALPPLATLAAGSCVWFQPDPGRTWDQKQLGQIWQDSLFGLGRYKQDGFGRFKVNWRIHEITP